MKRPLLITAIVSTLACVVFFSVQAYRDWRLPRATATLQIAFPTFTDESQAGTVLTGPTTNLSFLNESIELALASPEVQHAAKNANIDQERLPDIAKTEPVPNTDFIELIVKHESRAHAVSLVNAFADASVRIQKERNQKRAKELLQALQDELTGHEEHLKLQDQNVRSLIAEFSLQAPEIGAPFPHADTIPKLANENPQDDSSRKETYRKAVKAFHDSKNTLIKKSSAYPKASSAIRHSFISLLVRNYAQ